jgi:hypothetical protein
MPWQNLICPLRECDKGTMPLLSSEQQWVVPMAQSTIVGQEEDREDNAQVTWTREQWHLRRVLIGAKKMEQTTHANRMPNRACAAHLSPQNLETLRRVVESRGLAFVARLLGIHRGTLASVLCGRGRPSTISAVAAAFIAKASQVVP